LLCFFQQGFEAGGNDQLNLLIVSALRVCLDLTATGHWTVKGQSQAYAENVCLTPKFELKFCPSQEIGPGLLMGTIEMVSIFSVQILTKQSPDATLPGSTFTG